MDSDALAQLQQRLGVHFKDEALLRQALIHRSAAGDRSLDSNERLEFLGDSVVGLVASESLFRLFPDHSEGELAKAKAYVVSETVLADAARALGLEAFVVMSPGEAASGGRLRRSILADTFEAVMAAIFMDRGLRTARRVVQKALQGAMREVLADEHRRDYKSSLQEQTQAHLRKAPIYRIVSESGRDHEKVFTAEAILGVTVIGQGSGRNKKEAEQAAALNALGNLPRTLPELTGDAPHELESGGE